MKTKKIENLSISADYENYTTEAIVSVQSGLANLVLRRKTILGYVQFRFTFGDDKYSIFVGRRVRSCRVTKNGEIIYSRMSLVATLMALSFDKRPQSVLAGLMVALILFLGGVLFSLTLAGLYGLIFGGFDTFFKELLNGSIFHSNLSVKGVVVGVLGVVTMCGFVIREVSWQRGKLDIDVPVYYTGKS